MSTLTKKVIRRNLPVNDSYTLIDSYYTGMDNGTCCDNCNKIIANIAVIKNSENVIYNVGLDCAETLTNLNGLFAAQSNFNEAKAIRAKVNKAKKDNKKVTIENNCTGDILIQFDSFTVAWLKREFTQKYLPDLYNNIVNPEKNNFEAIPISEVNIVTYASLQTKEARDFFSNKQTYSFNQFTIDIYLTEGKKMDGTFNGSYLFTTDILLNGKVVGTDQTYMVKDINRNIHYTINKYLFNNF